MDNINFSCHHPFVMQRPLFKAYDIRGDVSLFTDDFVMTLAQTFAKHYQQAGAKTVVLGFDARHSSPFIAHQFSYQLSCIGLTVIYLGLVTTPMMAFCAECYEGHGIMITASHSDKRHAGIKWLTHHQSPSSDDIQRLYQSMERHHSPACRIDKNNVINNLPSVQCLHIFTDYQQKIEQVCQSLIKHDCHDIDHAVNPLLVIDCLNGATSAYAKPLLLGIAQMTGFANSIISLNDSPNGDFPKGDPDPTAIGRLTELAKTVVKHQAKMGLAFDGDGDRLCVIDEQGRLVSQDNLLYLLARIAIDDMQIKSQNNNEQTKSAILFDVKCSHLLPKLIQADGGTPILYQTGSSHLRWALKNKYQNAVFAGELSGHFIFNDGYFILHDDAMYAAVRLMIWLQKQTSSLADIIDSLPDSVSSADVYLPSSNRQSIMDKLMNYCQNNQSSPQRTTAIKPIQLNTTDGLRLEYEHGVSVLRISNTSPSFTCRIVGDTLYHFNAIKHHLTNLCRQVDTTLAKQIENIQPHSQTITHIKNQ